MGLSQEALARRVDCSKNTVARWEGDKTDISGEMLMRLSDVLSVSSDWIMRGFGAAPASENSTSPPHFDEFLDKYPDVDLLTPEQLAWMKEGSIDARGGLQIRSWIDWASLANLLQRRKPSKVHEERVSRHKNNRGKKDE